MTWVAWRQQRTESVLGIALLVLIAALLVPTGLDMASAYRHDHISACLMPNTSFACAQAVSSFHLRFGQLEGITGWLTLLPGLVGVMLAAPFVLQLEHGTYRLDWTQSITRRRWIVTKLGLAVGSALLFAAVFIALATWWRAPLVHLDGRMEQSAFDSQGVVALGYILFALGLALAVGVLWRRTAAALVVSFIAYIVGRIFVDNWLRQRLISPESVTWAGRKAQPAALNHAWVINEFPTDRLGHPLPLACDHPSPGITRCSVNAASYMHAVFEPASRFWTLQLTEFGLFAGVALVLIAFAGWWTNARAV